MTPRIIQEILSRDFTDKAFVETYDELPLWSASFGILLLDNVRFKTGSRILDIGPGTGFPMLEIAQRTGNKSQIFGIDPWEQGVARIIQKIEAKGIRNATVVPGKSEKLPFQDDYFDLIISNLGLSNSENPIKSLVECNRVLLKGGRLSSTHNTRDHWDLFFKILCETLNELKKENLIQVVKDSQELRGTTEKHIFNFQTVGLTIDKVIEKDHFMLFENGSAFLQHSFVQSGWLNHLFNLFPEDELEEIVSKLEINLNQWASKNSGLKLSVPNIYIEVHK